MDTDCGSNRDVFGARSGVFSCALVVTVVALSSSSLVGVVSVDGERRPAFDLLLSIRAGRYAFG